MTITRHALMASLALIMAAGGFGAPAWAQDASGFRPEALNGVCTDVRTGNSQRYEAKVLAAAGVSPEDSPEVMRSKVRALFDQHRPYCEGFDVRRGSLLKYAVNHGTSAFIYSAINVWNIDLNQVDVSDGQTVLDYLNAAIGRNAGNPGRRSLYESYHAELVRGGAKTRAELEAEGRRFPGIPIPAQ
ncbi:hypothetical protein [Brevundimonas sp.]|uniref:hypothetical protein n=1 Tax=Brevundimonas sp. TaxID=1871086 RepID=UPI00260A2CCC|nr:hypothetical protein [Brevundimonas sp.]